MEIANYAVRSMILICGLALLSTGCAIASTGVAGSAYPRKAIHKPPSDIASIDLEISGTTTTRTPTTGWFP